MSYEVRRTGRPLPRLARLLVGKNELRRRSDRIEGAVLMALSAVFLTAAVMAVFLAGHIYEYFYQSQHAAAAGLRPTEAVLSTPGPVASNVSESPALAQARWPRPDGIERSGFLTTVNAPAIYGARPGASVRIWLDRSGAPQPPPPGQRDMILDALFDALIAGLIITVGAAVLLIFCYRLCRLALDRHRLARWGSAWVATGPQWTDRW